MTFTPLDLFLVLLWSFVVITAAQRGIVGLVTGLTGTVLLKPLQLLALYNPLLALVAALFLGLLVGSSVRFLPRFSYRQPRWGYPLGALGGVILGSALVLTLLVSLPLERDLNGAVRYPSRELPFSPMFERSPLVAFGRVILLYPLLAESAAFAPERRGVLGVLHSIFVVGQPWEEASGESRDSASPDRA